MEGNNPASYPKKTGAGQSSSSSAFFLVDVMFFAFQEMFFNTDLFED